MLQLSKRMLHLQAAKLRSLVQLTKNLAVSRTVRINVRARRPDQVIFTVVAECSFKVRRRSSYSYD